jgi:hypothetical protein
MPDAVTNTPYATPRTVTDLSQCYFYHTIDIPGHRTVEGPWDLRAGVDAYLGGVDLRGKRVLELGTASGFLCFEMERRGAEVVACDLNGDLAHHQDLVPYLGEDLRRTTAEWSSLIHMINNAYWLCHRAFSSSARVVYSSVYDVPDTIGPVDIATFGCILLHLRDPFGALQSALPLVRDTVIITEPDWSPPLRYTADKVKPLPVVGWRRHLLRLVHKLCGDPLWRREVWLRFREELVWRAGNTIRTRPAMVFAPDFRRHEPKDAWWYLSPALLAEFLGMLGFGETRVTWHEQQHLGKPTPLFTVVGKRVAAGCDVLA